MIANGKEIAASRGPVVPDTLDWYFYERHEMYMPTLPKNRWLTLADINKLNGEIAVVVKANGQPIKTLQDTGCRRTVTEARTKPFRL